ncbi:MAG TPA: shikimate dehydrogenase [Solirubrobacteraceae bacterium]|nr:shikimate dehydrogenase [Solirubrobacteraceae bacterium]
MGEAGHRLGVIGWPVGHSLSPRFQNAGLAAAGLSGWRYQPLPLPPPLLDEVVRALPGVDFRGVNVTLPHKERALALADGSSSRAREIGAANTLVFGSSGVWADNTDAPGLVATLPWPVAGRSALVLGAGGVARAAVWALRDAGAAEVRVWNRTPERAGQLADRFGVTAVGEAGPADLLVHCTSLGLRGEPGLEGLPVSRPDLRGYGAVVDFVYRPGGTALTGMARQMGIPTVDGLELLLAQGALSFELFTGLPAPVAEMRSALGQR